MVRPRRGSQSVGLIIWFERSEGRGFDKDLFREPRPRHFACRSATVNVLRNELASAENVDAAVLSPYIGNVAHFKKETCFYHARDFLEFLFDYLRSA